MKTTYYVVATDDFTDETTHYIGTPTVMLGARGPPKGAARDQTPAVTGVVRRVWGQSERPWLVVPEPMDMTDPWQLAILIGGTARPAPEADVFFGKSHFVVFKVGEQGVVDVGWQDLGQTEETVIDEDPEGLADRVLEVEYFWDDGVIPPEQVPDVPCRVDNADYLVGFVDGQDLHDPYVHIGTSSAVSPLGAIRDVVERRGRPLWPPSVTTVEAVKTFDATALFPTDLEFTSRPVASAAADETDGP